MSRVAVRRNLTNTAGMVLVMALVALAVMTILLLALFQGTTHQAREGQGDAYLAREKMLADSAVALVIGQIQQASMQTNVAWISQPGLLRIYTTNAVRAPAACYKLYSTPSLPGMIDTTGTLAFFSTDVPTNWSSLPSQYTDLNSPVQSSGLTNYPVLDPAATNAVTGVSTDTGLVTMPVAWLYELQDGTLGPASNGTAANPIVARIAFWTDDDTCKININTAGCGSPWNTPRFNTTNDVAWSTTQPAAGEYSAYPGHPAMTSLAMVFNTNAYSPQQLLALTPRYAWGGSQFGTQTTTTNETVPAKLDRLYPTIDELCFSTNLSTAGQRETNSVSPSQLEIARFVLTARSESPETTLLGEPRVAIWPVADPASPTGSQLTTEDRAITNAATVGEGATNARSYFFERYNAQSSTDDLDTNVVPSNAQLFNDLVNRGNENLPGYGTTLAAKYPGAEWTQILLEIVDYIRCINAIDPSPPPFVSYAAGNSTNGAGYGFIDPLTTTYGAGTTNQVTLRGLGRCPTLSSLTLVLYVCGFGFKDGSVIDYDANPDDSSGSSWKANFLPGSPKWKNVTSELIRAFVVPCTFQPGCAYPEVSDACTIQITGLNGINVTSHGTTSNFGFPATAASRSLSDALTVPPADRAWGGNEGLLAWRAAAIDAKAAGSGSWMGYPFFGTNYFAVPMTTAVPTLLDPKTGAQGTGWPPLYPLTFTGMNGITVKILDRNDVTLQTLSVNFPAFTPKSPYAASAPTINGEYSFQDGSTNTVAPSYYMNLKNRALATQASRLFLLQPGDLGRSVEAATDPRVVAGLASVPAALFGPHPSYSYNQPDAHNLRFADGTAVYGASGTNNLVNLSTPYASATNTLTWTDWRTGSTITYAQPSTAPCSAPTGSKFVTMDPVGQAATPTSLNGDWDTGPGLSPDGAQINLPDSGTTNAPALAYFSLSGGAFGAPTQRTPNALVPSPVIFGSLPAGINPEQPAQSEPWRTLLFCPYPAANTNSVPYTAHPGTASPPDHVILDNFWMPVVEPYAISTCMATDGKINLNDQIAPFTYLHRNTALHALLNDLRIPATPVSAAGTYKLPGTPANTNFWNSVDENATIAQIENKFANNSADAYLSESEICAVPLVPQGVVPAGSSVSTAQSLLEAFWNGYGSAGGLTGDNLRELPYAQLYSRLTTRSNSYTVHVRVQVLQKLPRDPNQNIWNEGVDLVQGEWCGSYEIERYLDPAASAPAAGSPLGPYKFRVVSSRRFAP
jgi:uncharacterized protein (TIGR02600 family)